jgi:glutathione S-transferase
MINNENSMVIKAGNPSRDPRSLRPYQILSSLVSSYGELIRWILERAAVPYEEYCRVPVLHGWLNKTKKGGIDVPVFISSEVTLTDARQVVEYIDARVPLGLRLYPADPAFKAEAEHCLDWFFPKLASAVSSLFYSYYLPEKALLLPVMTYKVPSWNGSLLTAFYAKYCA